MIDKDDYLKAKSIVRQYEIEERERTKYRVELLHSEMTEYFKSHRPGGFLVENFVIREIFLGVHEIHPLYPDMDECYEDDEADAEIEEIGKKHGFEGFGFSTWCYPK